MLKIVNPDARHVHAVYGITEERNNALLEGTKEILLECGPGSGHPIHILLSRVYDICESPEEVVVAMFAMGSFMEKCYKL